MLNLPAISNKERAAYRKATVLVDRAIVEDDAKVASQLFRDAAQSAEELVEGRRADPEFNYLAGYINYRTPDKSLDIWKRAEHFLRQAVALSPDHQFAIYYLGCLLFDLKRYCESREMMLRIRVDTFKGLNQKWRIAKAYELVICCDLYLNPESVSGEHFEGLLSLYRDIGDPVIAPTPSELGACLSFLIQSRASQDTLLRFAVTAFLQLVKHIGLEDMMTERWPLVAAYGLGLR